MTKKTIDMVVEQHVAAAMDKPYRGMLLESVYSFATVFVPREEKRGYSPRRFQEYWGNRFLEHTYWGMRHPIVDVHTGLPVHPLLAQDAAWTESAQVVEGVVPDYRFVKLPEEHWLLMEYALSATFYDVMSLRKEVQE